MLKLVKYLIYKIRFLKLKIYGFNIKVGKNFVLGPFCSKSPKNKVKIGNNVFIGQNCHLAANIEIGNDVMVASYVSFVGGDHKIDNINVPMIYSGRDVLKTIKIEDDVWIGEKATILHGVTIKKGAVIGAGSVVTKDVPENSIFIGNPAKFHRFRVINQ